MKYVQPKDSLAQLWARLGIDQSPLVRAPKRAIDNERGPCTMMNMNLAAWLEEVQGYDVSQFDYGAFSQMTVKQYICQNSGFPTACLPGYNYRAWVPAVSLIQGMNLTPYNGVLFAPNQPCPSGMAWIGESYRIEFPNITNWARFLGGWIEHLNTIQSPFPTNLGGEIGAVNSPFLDLNNTGYLDLNDAMQWTTCIGYYGCN